MAIKTIMLRKERELKQKELDEVLAEAEELEKRSAELETAVEEVSNEEERAEVEKQFNAYEEDKSKNEEKKGQLERAIADIDQKIEEEEKNQIPADPEEKREEKKEMETRDINILAEREDVKVFAHEIREAISQKRAITNAGLTIPTVILPLIRETVEEESKLIPFVKYQRISGAGRVPIMGTIPEAVWTEMCANLNELALTFNMVEMDGYKVGAYVPICNAVVEDNDIDLVTKVYEAIGTALAIALDKAILYGTGTKMPMGIITRLAQTSAPADYPATARTWKDLHTSNIKTGTGKTGVALLQEVIGFSQNASTQYGRNAVWVMNHSTATALKSATLGTDSDGRVVAGVTDEMPVVGGLIIELNFVPDNNIIFGYFDDYALVERGEVRLEQSEHAQFIQDNLIVKGVGRFDGDPAIAEAFVLMSTTTSAPTTTMTFAPDDANPTPTV